MASRLNIADSSVAIANVWARDLVTDPQSEREHDGSKRMKSLMMQAVNHASNKPIELIENRLTIQRI